MPDGVTLTVDGVPITCPPGASLAAAMTESGRRAWRRTRHHGCPRGMFCGIGVCFDCLVTVNGVPGVRACLVTAEDGYAVTTDAAATDAAPTDAVAGERGGRRG